jgi:ornithine cyclodeaminase/alanine dehydrogenase-like protein (mu-crystallin family)
MREPDQGQGQGQGYETVPDDLRTGADQLRQASATDGVAANSVAQGDAASTAVFGSSGQAAHLAARWNAAVAARVREITELRQETDYEAASLQRNADAYDRDEAANRDRLRPAEVTSHGR